MCITVHYIALHSIHCICRVHDLLSTLSWTACPRFVFRQSEEKNFVQIYRVLYIYQLNSICTAEHNLLSTLSWTGCPRCHECARSPLQKIAGLSQENVCRQRLSPDLRWFSAEKMACRQKLTVRHCKTESNFRIIAENCGQLWMANSWKLRSQRQIRRQIPLPSSLPLDWVAFWCLRYLINISPFSKLQTKIPRYGSDVFLVK